MEIVATLITDLPMDAHRFRGLLMDVSRSSLAGAILQEGTEATHSFGEAARDVEAREVRVVVRKPGAVNPAALHELKKSGFQPAAAFEFYTDLEDPESVEDAWAVMGLYSGEVRGWVMTTYLDFEEAAKRMGTEEGLLHAPIGAGANRGVLISANALKLLTP